MQTIDLLGVAFGLAVLSGLNLYLTVFASGLAIRMGWVTLNDQFHQLSFLADPWILGVSGTFFLLEFFADKIPWVDTLWDTLHTVIRPLGGALLATKALGDASPTLLVIVGLLAGSMSFATHGLKAGTRLMANGSPEPFSNIGLSLGEDAAVLGGLALIGFNPIVALVVFLFVFAVILFYAPKLFRAVKVKVWLAIRKLNLPAIGKGEEGLSDRLPGSTAQGFARINLLGEKVLWAVPCISKKGKRIAPNLSGALIATLEERNSLYFVSESRWNRTGEKIDLEGGSVELVPGFLFDEVRLATADGKNKYAFIFDRPRGKVVEEMVQSIHNRLARPSTAPAAGTGADVLALR